MHDHRFRRRDLVAGAIELGQIHLVRAADDRLRVVDDDQPLAGGAAGEPVGVVVDRRRFADEEGVELGDAGVVVAADEFGLEPSDSAALTNLWIACSFDGGSVSFGIDAGSPGRTGVGARRRVRDAAAGEMLGRHLHHERPVRLGDFAGGDGVDAPQLPFAVLGKRRAAASATETG